MKKKLKVVVAHLLCFFTIAVNAAVPVWTFTPLTDTTVSVPDNTMATVQYQVSNQSSRAKQLVMLPINGVTSNGLCNLLPKGQAGSTCLLALTISGVNLPDGGVFGGPALCQINPDNSPNLNQCYQPTEPNILNISKVSSVFTVGGDVIGLQGNLVLQNNSTDALTRRADGHFTFPTPLAAGNTYAVTVFSSPANQICTVSNGHGTISDANITKVIVHCSTNSRTVGGNVTGLSGTVTLQNNSIDNLSISTTGPYTFPTPVAQGSNYDVTILTQPATQTCTVYNGDGTAGTTNITDVDVVCATNAYSVGGNITGLNGTVTLRNNKSDVLLSANDGSFTFNKLVAEGAPYDVEVLLQPSNQTCTVASGSGNMGSGNVNNVAVSCVDNPTQLSASVQKLALSVTGLTVGPTMFSGKARIITIENTGSSTAFNLTATPPTWPTGTISGSTCPANLTAGSSCVITITPGATATSTSGSINPCTASLGTAPNPGVLEVSSDNTSTISIDVIVLGYGCIYNGGYLFSVDDSSPNTGSIGGKVAALSDETDQPNFPFFQWATIHNDTGADSTSNGGDNTDALATPVGQYPSAQLCLNKTSQGFSDWYMPSICELGRFNGSQGSDAGCGTSNPNLYSNLFVNGVGLLSSLTYWSSTEYSSSPADFARTQDFDLGSQFFTNKFQQLTVRCIRSFLP